jgi:hypothetical protein
MRDDDLRSLQRAALTGGPADVLRLARALELVGRADDAVDALVAARIHPSTLRGDVWVEEPGGRNETRFVDEPPLATPPRVRWRTSHHEVGPMLANPWGLVAWSGSGSTLVLDWIDGQILLEIPRSKPVALDRDRLLVSTPELQSWVTWDLTRGEPVSRTPYGTVLEPRDVRRFVRDVWWRVADGYRPALAVGDLHGGGPAAGTVRGMTLRHQPPALVAGLCITPELVALRWPGCDEAWRGRGELVFADDRGVVATTRSSVLHFDLDGRERWSRDGSLIPWALTPDFVIAMAGAEHQIVAIERQSGEARVVAAAPAVPYFVTRDVLIAGTRVSLIRRVLGGWGTHLVAIRLADGGVLWELDLPNRVLLHLVPSWRRLCGKFDGGGLFCLEPS